jgi:hypothetical protein
MATIGDMFANLWEVGIPYFLEFMLVMAISYGVLRRAEMFEDETVDGAVAIGAAFFATWGTAQYAGGQAVFSWFFGFLAIALVFLLGYGLVLGVLGVDVAEMSNENPKRRRNIGIIAALIAAGVISLVMQGFYGQDMLALASNETVVTAVMLLGLLWIVYVIAKPTEEE